MDHVRPQPRRGGPVVAPPTGHHRTGGLDVGTTLRVAAGLGGAAARQILRTHQQHQPPAQRPAAHLTQPPGECGALPGRIEHTEQVPAVAGLWGDPGYDQAADSGPVCQPYGYRRDGDLAHPRLPSRPRRWCGRSGWSAGGPPSAMPSPSLSSSCRPLSPSSPAETASSTVMSSVWLSAAAGSPTGWSAWLGLVAIVSTVVSFQEG